jgi:hypothetical protein
MKFDAIVNLLLESLEEKYLILLPGGYKPPTAGHMHMIESYNNNPKVEKVLVLIGPKEREGITREQAIQVFKLYNIDRYKKVELVPVASDNPMSAGFEFLANINDGPYAGKFKNLIFAMGASDKGDDATRANKFASYFINNQNKLPEGYQVGMPPIVKALESLNGDAISATNLRAAIRNKDKAAISKLIPTGINVDKFLAIFS